MLSKISFHVRFSTPVFYVLAGGMPLFPFCPNLLSTCFIYFCACKNCLLTLMITESMRTEKALIPRIQLTAAQGCSSSYLKSVGVLQWSDFSFHFSVFIILRGQRRAFCQWLCRPQFLIHCTTQKPGRCALSLHTPANM